MSKMLRNTESPRDSVVIPQHTELVKCSRRHRHPTNQRTRGNATKCKRTVTNTSTSTAVPVVVISPPAQRSSVYDIVYFVSVLTASFADRRESVGVQWECIRALLSESRRSSKGETVNDGCMGAAACGMERISCWKNFIVSRFQSAVEWICSWFVCLLRCRRNVYTFVQTTQCK